MTGVQTCALPICFPVTIRGATGTGGVSSGGGTGPGIGAGTAPGGAGPGTQAVMMGLQAKAIESQIDDNKATARKINAEATNTSADLPTATVRFPATGFKVFRYNDVLDSLVSALLGAFDTRNRIIEVENPQNPTTAETAYRDEAGR